MNRNLQFLLTSLFFLCTMAGSAQVSLPYYTGFDNTEEQAGWRIYRTGEDALSNWGVATVGGFSPTSAIGHDYAPSTGAGLADDWYVSPGFLIPDGGTLDSVRYAFSGFSVPADDDTVGVFLLTGSADPEAATSITLLMDFRGDDYIADFTYRLLSGVALPPTPDSAFIAIRYRNAQVSSRWLTVRFDNIAVSALTTSVNNPVQSLITSLYPNPAGDEIHIDHDDAEGLIVIYDLMGRAIKQKNITTGQFTTTFSLSGMPNGLYTVSVLQKKYRSSERFIKR